MNHKKLTITFLGTGTSSGIPMIACDCSVCKSNDSKDKRLRASVLIQSDETTLVIDTTPDFRYQMLRENVRKLDAVLFTHPHKDHLAGLDDVRAFNFTSKGAMNIYANSLTEEALKREFAYAFADKRYPGVPVLELNTIGSEPFNINDLTIIPILVWHMKMPVLGFRIGDFTYITDANRIDEPEREKIRGSKVLVLNALRKEKHISHFNLKEAIEMSNDLRVEQTYFTHISHQLGLHSEIQSELPESIQLAYDQLKIKL